MWQRSGQHEVDCYRKTVLLNEGILFSYINIYSPKKSPMVIITVIFYSNVSN